jgi:hypothetical protein
MRVSGWSRTCYPLLKAVRCKISLQLKTGIRAGLLGVWWQLYLRREEGGRDMMRRGREGDKGAVQINEERKENLPRYKKRKGKEEAISKERQQDTIEERRDTGVRKTG